MMDELSPGKEIIARFGSEIGRLHELRVDRIRSTLQIMAAPESKHDGAIAAYYNPMDRDQLVVAIAQRAIEGILHDVFFLFDESEEFKIVLQARDGTQVNLADAVDVIQAFPFDWIERRSSAGLEINREGEFITEKLNLRETRQERRVRILREKEQARSNDQS